MAIDKAALLGKRCPERDVELPSGGTVRVRGLTRGQVKAISEGMEAGQDMEPQSLAWGLVEPELTLDEAKILAEDSPFDDVQTLAQAINELSGIAGRADKEAYKSSGEQPGA